MRMISKCRKFWALSASERRAILESYTLLWLCVLGTRVLGFYRCRRFLERRGVAGNHDRPPEAGRLAELSQIAVRLLPFEVKCLNRSLALWWLLRRHGFRSELQVGVRIEDQLLKAHAWIEHEGIVLNDDPAVHERFTKFEASLC